MFVAMNKFRVKAGQEQEFERIWRERETYLQGVAGFQQFALLRADTPGEYISHSTWADRESFIAWTQSEAFGAGHRQGSLMGVLDGPPPGVALRGGDCAGGGMKVRDHRSGLSLDAPERKRRR